MIRARKRFGQHFLEPAWVEKLVAAIDPRPDLGPRTFDFYYGMADWSIGAARMTLGARVGAREPAESAA